MGSGGDFGHKKMSGRWPIFMVARRGDLGSAVPLTFATMFCVSFATLLGYHMCTKGTEFRWRPSKRSDKYSEVNNWADKKDNGFIFGIGTPSEVYEGKHLPPKY
eukprot:scpid101145/ scgid26696/ 